MFICRYKPAMLPLLLVMLGGAIGAGARYEAGQWALGRFGPDFPWGTWIINLSGGLLMGLLIGFLVHMTEGREHLRLLVGVGVLGGFTTFSAFSLEAFNMVSRGDYMHALFYVLSSAIGSILMVGLGIWTMRIIG